MNFKTLLHVGLLFLGSLGLSFPAYAGRSCKQQPATPTVLRDAAQASTRVAAQLSQSTARVALLARIGQDLSQHSLLYSHAAFVIRDRNNRWQVIHLLNVCGTARGMLVSEGLLQFYLDDLLSYQTKIVYFTPVLEHAVFTALKSHQGKAVFQPQYSVIARPYSKRWQNSTAWVLELIAAALAPGPDSRAEAFGALHQRSYQAQRIHISYAQRLGAALFRSNIQFLEHPLSSRIGGRYQTSSVRSILNYLRDQRLITEERLWVPPRKAELFGD